MSKVRLLLVAALVWATIGIAAAPAAGACEPHKKSCGSCWVNLDGGAIIECHS